MANILLCSKGSRCLGLWVVMVPLTNPLQATKPHNISTFVNAAAVCSFAFQFLWKHAVRMSKISTVLWNYYFDLSFPPPPSHNLLYHLSGWIFNTLKRLLSLSGRVCYPAYPRVCILGSDGSRVLTLRSAPFPHPPCSVGWQVVGACVEHM